MLEGLRSNRAVATLSTLSLLVMLERIFLDFRYVALEMEAAQAYLPFTLPYLIGAFVMSGGWIWALLAKVQGSRTALIPLLLFNALGTFFAVFTITSLCPTPCRTAAPISDILIYLQLVVSLSALGSTALSLGMARPASL